MADKKELIKYAYDRFKEAQKEIERNSNVMEYWFKRAVNLNSQNTGDKNNG